MPSVRYYNQTAPFWDFVADLEERGVYNTNNRNTTENDSSDNEKNECPNPWVEGWAGFPWGPFPHRGRHGSHHHGPTPTTPPPHDAGTQAPPTAEGEEGEAGPSVPRGPPPPFSETPEEGRHHHHGRHGPGARGAHCGGRGRRGGGFGGWGRGRGQQFHPYAMGTPFRNLAEIFQQQIFAGADGGGVSKTKDSNEDFHPDIDVFDTSDSFIVHVSLPGAKKEDIGVNWDAEKSELSIAGVVYRPGDEEFLKTLALDERKIGAFERKVRLGSRANPAQVDVEGIAARLEDGVLSVEVPKMDGGFVEVKKVDVE